MGISSFLSGSVVPPAPTGSDVSSTQPLWYQDYLYNISNAATNLAQQPYVNFPGQQVATPSAATTQSWNMALNNAGAGLPTINQGAAQVGNATAPLSQSTINSYLNPYQNYVTGALNYNLMNNILPQTQSQFVSAGQAASPQQQQAYNNAIYNTQQAAGQALAQNYQGALNTATTEQQLGLQGGAALGQLGIAQQQVGAANTGLVAAAGQAQDTLSQANINAAMNNFYQQQQWPYQNLGFLSNAVRGLTLPTSTQTASLTQPATYTTSPISAFVGTAAASNALSSLGLKKGGRVMTQGALERYFAEAA